MDCSPPASSVHGMGGATVLEWVPIPSPGNLPNPGIELGSPVLQAYSLPSEPPRKFPSNGAYYSQIHLPSEPSVT